MPPLKMTTEVRVCFDTAVVIVIVGDDLASDFSAKMLVLTSNRGLQINTALILESCLVFMDFVISWIYDNLMEACVLWY